MTQCALEDVQFPGGVTQLYTSLADVDVTDLIHRMSVMVFLSPSWDIVALQNQGTPRAVQGRGTCGGGVRV